MKLTSLGFSLIELMIVVTIIGILTSLALPSYQNYTRRARYTEVLAATEPYKTAVTLALQQGFDPSELNNNSHGIPAEPLPTQNLASLKVEQGTIIATGSERVKNATYILKPDPEGNHWSIAGSCQQLDLCDF